MFFVPRGQSIFHAVPVADSLFSPRAIGGLGGLALLGILIWRAAPVHSLISVGSSGSRSCSCRRACCSSSAAANRWPSTARISQPPACSWPGAASSGILWAHTDRRRLLVAVTTVVFLAQLGFQTFIRNVIWHDPVVLSREAAILAPDALDAAHPARGSPAAERALRRGCDRISRGDCDTAAGRDSVHQTRRMPDSRAPPRGSRGTRWGSSTDRQSQVSRRGDGAGGSCASVAKTTSAKRALPFGQALVAAARPGPGETAAGVRRGRAAPRRAPSSFCRELKKLLGRGNLRSRCVRCATASSTKSVKRR